MIQKLWLPIVFPSLNELIDAAKGYNGRGKEYSSVKDTLTNQVALLTRVAHLQPVTCAKLSFRWVMRDRKIDPDNYVAAGRKVVLDGLVVAKILPGDGWKHLTPGWSDTWEVGSKPGVEVTIEG